MSKKSSFRPLLPLKAGAAVAINKIVKHGTADNKVIQATADSEALLGVSDRPAAADGDPIDIVVHGVAPVKYGGAVTRGAWLTSDANGDAVVTSANGKQVIGRALVAGADNDIGEVLLAQGQL